MLCVNSILDYQVLGRLDDGMDEPVGTGRDGSCGPIDGQVFVKFVLLLEYLGVLPIGISTIATSSCMCMIKCHIMTHMPFLFPT